MCLFNSAWHMYVCMPRFNLRSRDIMDHKEACSLHHCQCPVCHPHLSSVISSFAGDSHGISSREDSLCRSPPALCLWNDLLYLSPSSPLQCVGSVAKTSIRVLLPRISLRACAYITNMNFASNKAPEQSLLLCNKCSSTGGALSYTCIIIKKKIHSVTSRYTQNIRILITGLHTFGTAATGNSVLHKLRG